MTTHLLPLEPAARILCNMRGEDPDATTRVAGAIIGGYAEIPNWHHAAEALLGLSQMLVAMKQAAAAQTPAEPTH